MILVTLRHFVQAGGFAAVPNVLTAEALVAKEGLELAVECGVYKTILEVDCSELKICLRCLCFDITEMGRSCSDFRIAWECRDANSVAHSCDCVGSDRGSVWMPVILGHA